MGVAFVVNVAIAALALSKSGAGVGGTTEALRLTARWSYVLFWLAYAGGALATLFGARFAALARRGRELGLAFAAAHLVHVALVVWLYHISREPPVGRFALVYFGIAVVFTYLLALLSVSRVTATLAPALWRWVRLVGVEYIALAFLRDFLGNPFRHGILHAVAYLPFLALAGAGICLRLAAFAKRRLGVARVPGTAASPEAARSGLP